MSVIVHEPSDAVAYPSYVTIGHTQFDNLYWFHRNEGLVVSPKGEAWRGHAWSRPKWESEAYGRYESSGRLSIVIPTYGEMMPIEVRRLSRMVIRAIEKELGSVPEAWIYE